MEIDRKELEVLLDELHKYVSADLLICKVNQGWRNNYEKDLEEYNGMRLTSTFVKIPCLYVYCDDTTETIMMRLESLKPDIDLYRNEIRHKSESPLIHEAIDYGLQLRRLMDKI